MLGGPIRFKTMEIGPQMNADAAVRYIAAKFHLTNAASYALYEVINHILLLSSLTSRR